MSHIAIPIPTIPGKHNIEIQVIINNEVQSQGATLRLPILFESYAYTRTILQLETPICSFRGSTVPFFWLSKQ